MFTGNKYVDRIKTIERFSELIDIVPSPVFIQSLDNDFIHVNEPGNCLLNSTFGSTALFFDQLKGNYGLVGKIFRLNNLQEKYQSVLNNGTPLKNIFIAFSDDIGSEYSMLVNISPLREIDNDKIIGFITAIEDVTQIFKYNRELNYSLKHLEGLIEAFAKDKIAYLLAYGQEETVRHLLEVRTFSEIIASRIMQEKSTRNKDFQEYSKITPLYIKMMELSALLHDFGKIHPPINAVIKQPRKLEPEEYETVKQHTVIGADLIGQENEILKMCWLVARHHHEKWDGSGYPDGLKGNDIPLSARIVAFADMYSALRNKRAYKDPIEKTEDIIEIFMENEKDYDPIVFKIGIELIEEMQLKYSLIDLEFKNFAINAGSVMELISDVFQNIIQED